MEKIGILIDSTSLTRAELKEYPFIKIVSLYVTLDGTSRKEEDITTEEMIEQLHKAKHITTSQPAPGEFLEKYEEFHNEGYTNVLVVTISDKLSGTYQSAMIAKTMIDFEMDISIHAPQLASFGVANGVALLAEMVAEGASFEEVQKRYYTIFKNGAVMFTLGNLMNLFRGGRLNRIQALLGTVLRIKPIVEMVEGKLQLTKKERTNLACFEYFMNKADEYCQKFKKVYFDIIHLNRPEWAEKIRLYISGKYPAAGIHMTDYVSPVFFAHLGDQGFGLAVAAE
ncbi:MAG TPA: DegV family protein [Bacillota bacterium]|nr:DegV family protein [Bacillota bacterium]HPF42201.1 DegV family protein [Bacillota bacterium]HPQ61756.1 DegV family protein [Bacillota bacterium]HRX91258.1 DegV family protein [Candidatus Izemoplasmatales bacterium]